MLAIGAALGIIGLGFFYWLLFTLAVYAVPAYAGVAAGLYAYCAGAGPLGAGVVGVSAGAVLLVVAQFVISLVQSSILRFPLILLFVAPAALAGYQVNYGLAALTTSSDMWQQCFALTGAIAVGISAWVRLTEASALRRPIRVPTASRNAGWTG